MNRLRFECNQTTRILHHIFSMSFHQENRHRAISETFCMGLVTLCRHITIAMPISTCFPWKLFVWPNN